MDVGGYGARDASKKVFSWDAPRAGCNVSVVSSGIQAAYKGLTMHTRLILSVVLTSCLFVVPVFSQDSASEPTYSGRVSGESGDIRTDFEALRALQAARSGSGLEVENYLNIKLLVADVPPALMEIGLTREQVRTGIEGRLQSLNLTPLPEDDAGAQWIYVAINGVGSAYNVEVSFFRNAYYLRVNDSDVFAPTDPDFTVLTNMAVTWTTGSIGTHGGDPNFVLNSLRGHVDEFVTAYLAANQP